MPSFEDQVTSLISAYTTLKQYIETIYNDLRVRYDSSETATDLANITKSGFYNHLSSPDAPLTGFDGRLIHIQEDDGQATQIDVLSNNVAAFRDKDLVDEPFGEWSFLWSGERTMQSLNNSGYQLMPSGLIMQWGVFTGLNGDQVSFTIPFPNACFVITTTENELGTTVGALNKSVTGFDMGLANADGSPRDTGTPSLFYWTALGR